MRPIEQRLTISTLTPDFIGMMISVQKLIKLKRTPVQTDKIIHAVCLDYQQIRHLERE